VLVLFCALEFFSSLSSTDAASAWLAEKFLSREIEFLAARGHQFELDKTALPFLVRKGFHPKLGARPMRDAVEKLVGDAVTECLLAGRAACGMLAHDEMRDCLGVF
jgi:ATP-dependent Clp protease ATP-binding subunit ClpA